MPLENYVLQNFPKSQEGELEKILEISADAAESWMSAPEAQALQTKYNRNWL
jgi:peptidyl-tRNA hydrolase